jgi:hypothetical protein
MEIYLNCGTRKHLPNFVANWKYDIVKQSKSRKWVDLPYER